MSVDRALTERIAALARLGFEPEELDRLTEELNRILDHVEALQSLDGAPGSMPADDPQAWSRASTRGPGAETPDGLGAGPEAMAPDWREGFFVVPPLPGMHEDESA